MGDEDGDVRVLPLAASPCTVIRQGDRRVRARLYTVQYSTVYLLPYNQTDMHLNMNMNEDVLYYNQICIQI